MTAATWSGWSDSPQATEALGRALGALTQRGDVVALVGELGAGKTQLVRGLALGMGLDPRQVASPTFVFIHEYEPTQPSGVVLVHIDAYRLRHAAELETIGWHLDTGGAELRQDAVVVIEWADRVEAGLGDDGLRIVLAHDGDQQRRITLAAGSAWRDRWSSLLQHLRSIPQLRSEAHHG
jgi:tRNA threonylcarbamoyladenosine biosynthesis protein TsaE